MAAFPPGCDWQHIYTANTWHPLWAEPTAHMHRAGGHGMAGLGQTPHCVLFILGGFSDLSLA